MRLFISYARVDKPYCIQIAETLDVHKVWYDQRISVGDHWWKEILRRLDWCEGFVYLLSPDSVASDYCQREFVIAQKTNRHIFPVLLNDTTIIPEDLQDIQYADFSQGFTPDAVKTLLSAIYTREMQQKDNQKPVIMMPAPGDEMDVVTLVNMAMEAFQSKQYDQAVYLLKRAKESNQILRFVDLDGLLKKAEAALEKESQRREYSIIAGIIRSSETREIGCLSFQAFHSNYPDYDPDNLAALCSSITQQGLFIPHQKTDFKLPMLEWCSIPTGPLHPMMGHNSNGKVEPMVTEIKSFAMSKYPVTNAQFDVFIKEGYNHSEWWNFSEAAKNWRQENKNPKGSKYKGEYHPKENVTWYEAMAFCRWLSHKTGLNITLPTGEQWQRAARGDDTRLYPWGNHFEIELANTRESKIRATTPVNCYATSQSMFGVFDMAGNTWEWCLTPGPKDSREQEGEIVRAVHGGSFISEASRAQTGFHYNLPPDYHYYSIGFRIIALPD